MSVRLELAKGLSRHLKAGHPWVFRKALKATPKLPPGAVVDLVDDGRFVARGYWDPLSAIAVRILTRNSHEAVGLDLFRDRVAKAHALRRRLLDLRETDAFRLIHGEGDGLPGVVVDLYAGWAVLKLYSAGLTAYRALILEALRREIPGLKGIVGRDELGRDDMESAETGSGRMLWGEPAPERITILEKGARFLVDVYRGQKTGFFLDQRENRFRIRELAKDRDVLNCFCFSGGFSVNAALGGAKRVFSVDQDEEAIALARENFALNEVAPERHDFLAADVFDLLGSFEREGRTFDLVILDPPAFAKSQKAVPAALAGYASLNRQALGVLSEGGLLVTSSCSARVTPEQFFSAVKEAGFKASVDLALIDERYQPADHPIRLQFPEGRYLKWLALAAV